MEAQKDAEVPGDAEPRRDKATQKAAEAREEAETQKDADAEKEAEVRKGAAVRKDRAMSTERKGSNEPIMPVEELLGTALSSKPLPEPAQQLSADTGVTAGDGAGSLQAFGRGMRQASVQDVEEEQHQDMAAAQKQVACSPSHSASPACRSPPHLASGRRHWHGLKTGFLQTELC